MTDDRPIYAIGDIHGRRDLAVEMLAAVRKDSVGCTNPGQRPSLVLVGDYIDRGPQSREVIELLSSGAMTSDFDVHFLRGNHEQVLSEVVEGRLSPSAWMRIGGLETLKSYDIPVASLEAANVQESARRLAAEIPADHRDFLDGLLTSVVLGRYLFVHAGVRPGVAVDQQSERDLLWIREPFLSHPNPLPPFIVVHGHTPTAEPVLARGRIGVDTGAFTTGKLTAVRLWKGATAFAQTGTGSAPSFVDQPEAQTTPASRRAWFKKR